MGIAASNVIVCMTGGYHQGISTTEGIRSTNLHSNLVLFKKRMTVNILKTVKNVFSKQHCHIRSMQHGVIYLSICRNRFFMNFKVEEY